MYLVIGVLFITFTSYGQKRTVSGLVKEADGSPLIGVTVVIKGTTTGTITNLEGRYSVETTSGKDVLVFTYLGYNSVSEQVGSRTVINVTMTEETQNLDELVVVGYGTQKKSDLTGSVVSVKAEAMNAVPTASMAEMLRGKAAGVVITQNSNRPGGGSDILIRGKKSLTGGNAPLFIVDGVPVSNIDDFNSQDIQSVEVLKDASSQSIYGARASNGVILITTKKGANNKTTVELSTYLGTQNVKRNFDLYTPDEWIQLKREANRSLTKLPDGTYTTEYLGGNPDANGVYPGDASLFGNMYQNIVDRRFTDWEALMIKPATQQKHDISIRSGNENTKISATLGFFDQNGMVAPAAYTRGTFGFNAEHKFTKKITIGVNTLYAQSYRKVEDGTFKEFITKSPLLTPTDADGNLKNLLEDSKWNPIWNNQNMLNEQNINRLLINPTLDWQITKGLKYRLNTSLNSRSYEQGTYLNSKHQSGSSVGGKATIENYLRMDYLLENILTWDWKINANNKLDATFVQSVNSITDKTTTNVATGFSTDDLGYNNIGSAALTSPVDRTITPRGLLSYMGRVRYNLMDKYLFSLSARIDGSSVFGENNKWGIFPATSFAWRASEESFLKDKEWLTNLKLRLSYGEVGNQAISPYGSQGLANSTYMEFGENAAIVGYLPGGQLPNPNLKWETTSSFNSGIDFGFLRDRISGTIEYYNTVTRDLLQTKSLSSTSGYSSQLVNIGKVLNRGLEVTLNFVPVKSKDFIWSVDLNFSSNHNEILELDGSLDANGKPKNDLANGWYIGYNIDATRTYVFDGIWQLTDVIPDFGPGYKPMPGDIKVKDMTGDGLITTDDMIIRNESPQWTGSIGSTVKWKGIDFSFDFYTVQGTLKSNLYLYDGDSGGDLHGVSNGIKVDYWTVENPSNTNPRARNATIDYFSSLSYQDASYVRLRNVSLGYNFPKKLISTLKMTNLRVYATATNLWTQTNFLSYSPEMSAGAYPEPKTYVIGLNVSF